MKKQKVAGFTLIELLIVMAVIAILAGMLLPVLARAKELSRRANCASNLREWGLAQNMYLDDSNQVFPDAKITNGTPGAPSTYNEDTPLWTDLLAFAAAGQGMTVWYNVLPPYVGKSPLWQYAANPSTFVNAKTIFTCPTSDALPPDFNLLQRIVFNYGMNYKGNTGTDTSVPFTAKMVLHPSAFVFLSESRTHGAETPFYGTDPTNELGTSHCCYAMESSRHNAGANLTFADGHAAYFHYSYICANVGSRPGDPGDPDINWTYNGQPVP
jgi:prepilin-type N-terminal cleavage/methylation domain-containing protein/prepilin-type processing-associated H-X9-DG protein